MQNHASCKTWSQIRIYAMLSKILLCFKCTAFMLFLGKLKIIRFLRTYFEDKVCGLKMNSFFLIQDITEFKVMILTVFCLAYRSQVTLYPFFISCSSWCARLLVSFFSSWLVGCRWVVSPNFTHILFQVLSIIPDRSSLKYWYVYSCGSGINALRYCIWVRTNPNWSLNSNLNTYS